MVSAEDAVDLVTQVVVDHVQVPDGGVDTCVPEEALNGVEVHAATQEAGGVGVSPSVGMGVRCCVDRCSAVWR